MNVCFVMNTLKDYIRARVNLAVIVKNKNIKYVIVVCVTLKKKEIINVHIADFKNIKKY